MKRKNVKHSSSCPRSLVKIIISGQNVNFDNKNVKKIVHSADLPFISFYPTTTNQMSIICNVEEI